MNDEMESSSEPENDSSDQLQVDNHDDHDDIGDDYCDDDDVDDDDIHCAGAE